MSERWRTDYDDLVDERIAIRSRYSRLSSAHEDLTAMLTAADFDVDALMTVGKMRTYSERAAAHLRISLGEPEWVALLRVAVTVLGLAVEEPDLDTVLIAPDLDRLSEVLRRIDEGEA